MRWIDISLYFELYDETHAFRLIFRPNGSPVSLCNGSGNSKSQAEAVPGSAGTVRPLEAFKQMGQILLIDRCARVVYTQPNIRLFLRQRHGDLPADGSIRKGILACTSCFYHSIKP